MFPIIFCSGRIILIAAIRALYRVDPLAIDKIIAFEFVFFFFFIVIFGCFILLSVCECDFSILDSLAHRRRAQSTKSRQG